MTSARASLAAASRSTLADKTSPPFWRTFVLVLYLLLLHSSPSSLCCFSTACSRSTSPGFPGLVHHLIRAPSFSLMLSPSCCLRPSLHHTPIMRVCVSYFLQLYSLRFVVYFLPLPPTMLIVLSFIPTFCRSPFRSPFFIAFFRPWC